MSVFVWYRLGFVKKVQCCLMQCPWRWSRTVGSADFVHAHWTGKRNIGACASETAEYPSCGVTEGSWHEVWRWAQDCYVRQLPCLETGQIYSLQIETAAIISLYNINWLVYMTETDSVYCAVRTGYLNVIWVICFIWIWEQTAIISQIHIKHITQIIFKYPVRTAQ